MWCNRDKTGTNWFPATVGRRTEKAVSISEDQNMETNVPNGSLNLKTKRKRTLQNRRLQDIAILMYKVKNNLSPNYICSLFQIPQLKYTLRNNDFGIPRFNTVTFGKHSLRYMGPKIWAIVPRNVRELTSISSFKCNIRRIDLVSKLTDSKCENCLLCKT